MLTTRNHFVCYFMELNAHNNINQNKTFPNTQPKKFKIKKSFTQTTYLPNIKSKFLAIGSKWAEAGLLYGYLIPELSLSWLHSTHILYQAFFQPWDIFYSWPTCPTPPGNCFKPEVIYEFSRRFLTVKVINIIFIKHP